MSNTANELAARFLMLGPDHREIFELLLDKAESGAKKYGTLDLDNDPRDFEAECRDELVDGTQYLGAEVIRLKRANRRLSADLALARQEIEQLRNRLSVAQRLVPR